MQKAGISQKKFTASIVFHQMEESIMLNTPIGQNEETDLLTYTANPTNEHFKKIFKAPLKESATECNDTADKLQIIWEFYWDIYHLIYEFVPAVATLKFEYIVDTIEKFYYIWINSNTLANTAGSQMEQYTGTILSSLLTVSLSIQLMWATHYSLQTSFALTSLTIAMGVNVTRPEYVSVGILSNGFFKFRVINTRAFFKNTLPIFHR